MLKFKKIKKTLALVMALAFCLCALPTVITAEAPAYALNGTIKSLMTIIESTPSTGTDTEGEINIQLQTGGTGDTGAIFTAYKLLNIERDDTTKMLKVSIPNTGDAQDFWNQYVTSVGNVLTGDATIKDIKKAINTFGSNDSQKSSSIVDEFVKYGGRDFIKEQSSKVVSGRAKITTKFGFYAILQTGAPVNGHIASAPVLACLPMQQTTGGPWLTSYTVEPKDDTISIDKRVKATGDGDTYKDETITNIGDTVSYEIIAELPTYGADIVKNGITYKIEDAPNDTNQLLLLNTSPITIEYSNNNGASYETVPSEKYTLSFTNSKLELYFNNYVTDINGQYDKIRITYSALLNGSAVVEGDGNTNTATLTYSSYADKTTTTTANAKVYTLELDITKVDNDDPSIKLDGAVFQVYRTDAEAANPTNAIKFIDISGNSGYESGKHYRVATDAEITAGTNITTDIEVATSPKGEMNIYGLNDQDYHFKEIAAPVGYNIPGELFPIAVKPETFVNSTDHGDYDVTGAELSFNDTHQSKSIKNDSGINLPVTGGMGTILFTAIGLLLMAGAAYFLFAKKKESR